MPEAQPIPTSDLAVITQSAEDTKPVSPDQVAVRERDAIASEDYEAADAKDSYDVRSTLRLKLKHHAECIFWSGFILCAFLCIGFLAMGGAYLWHLLQTPDKLGPAVAAVTSHIAAALLGFLSKAFFSKNKKMR